MKSGRADLLFVLELLIMYRILCTYVPAVSVWSPTIINMPVLGLLYLLFIYFIGAEGIVKIFERVFPVILLYVVNDVMRSGFSMVDMIMSIMRLLVWPVGMYIFYKYDGVGNVKRILLVFVASMVATMLTTYYGNIEFPGVSRAMAHFHADGMAEQSRFFKRLNIGDFDFVYTLPFLPPFAIFCFKKVSEIWLKALSVGFCVVLALTIYEAHYTTALVTSALSVTLLILPNNISMKKMIVYYVLIAVVLVGASSTVSSLLGMASDTTDAGVYAERFQNMSDMMSGNDIGEGNTANRIMLYQKSLMAFLEHPILGGAPGGHSMVLDMMGRGGFFGLFVVIIGLMGLYKNYVQCYRNQPLSGYCVYLFVLQILLGVLNPVLCLEVFLLLIPLFSLSFDKVENKR